MNKQALQASKAQAFILYQRYGVKQPKLAIMFDVNQATISRWIKEMRTSKKGAYNL